MPPSFLYLNYYLETKLFFYMFRIFLILLFFISFNVFAHQPKLITYSPSKDNPYEVINPEISKASTLPKEFYLDPQYFKNCVDNIFPESWQITADKNNLKKRQFCIYISPFFLT